MWSKYFDCQAKPGSVLWMAFVTADLYDLMIVANDLADGDIDDICMFFVSPGKFVHGVSSPDGLFVNGFLSPSIIFVDGCCGTVAE